MAAVVVRAVHDEALTWSKHRLSGKQVMKALAKGEEAHVFNDDVDLVVLEARVWAEGAYLGKVGMGHRTAFERFVWRSPVPIGRRIQAGTNDLPLNWVEVKGKMAKGAWVYHLTPRSRPPA